MLLSTSLLAYLPLIVVAISAVVLLIAFLVGCKKGARKVSWSGFVWLFAAVLFVVLDKTLFAENNPIAAMFSNLGDAVGAFIGSFVLAIVACVVALVLYGVCTLAFRPRVKRIKKKADIYSIDDEGVEYDEEYYDYDDYEEYASRKMVRFKGYGTPSIFSRLFGGILCAVNVLMVLAVIVCAALLVINATQLSDGLGEAMSAPLVQKAVEFSRTYAMDVAIVGILIGYACKGRRKGFMETLRSFFCADGGTICAILAFVLPFMAMPEGSALAIYVSRCEDAANQLFGLILGQFTPIIGKLLAGLILWLVSIVLLKLLDALLKKISEIVYARGFLNVVDGLLACAIYFIIGIVVVALLWAVWYVLSYFRIFTADKLFATDASLSYGLFKTMEQFLKPILDQIKGMFAGGM